MIKFPGSKMRCPNKAWSIQRPCWRTVAIEEGAKAEQSKGDDLVDRSRQNLYATSHESPDETQNTNQNSQVKWRLCEGGRVMSRSKSTV